MYEIACVHAHAILGTIAVKIINEGEELEPQLFIVEVKNKDDNQSDIEGIIAIDPRLVMMMQRDGMTKDALMAMIRKLLNPQSSLHQQIKSMVDLRPDFVVHITEAWIASYLPDNDPLSELAPSERHDRTESLMMLIHTPDHTYNGISRIVTKDGKRHVELEPLDMNATNCGGRFNMEEPD
jgi:hypothetical protein